MADLAVEEQRALEAVAAGLSRAAGAGPSRATLTDDGTRHITVSLDSLSRLARRGLVARSEGRLVVTREGIAALKRAGDARQPFLAQHLNLQPTAGPDGTSVIDLSESPLAQMMRRRGRDGRAFLDRREFDAGERLRLDFTRGQLMPRLGANWERPISSGRGGGAVADLSDAALSARLKVERALDAVGPELSGVLVDVCCFLKGLETVERERSWPVRSAKLMLKAGLGALARHYEPERGGPARGAAILSWGAEGYRPSLGG